MRSNRVAVFCHMNIHHCLSSNSSLENSEREQGHLSRYYRNRKNTFRIVFRERAYSATGNSRVEIWLRHPANCIPVGQGLYMQFTRPCPLLRKWVWLARLDPALVLFPSNCTRILAGTEINSTRGKKSRIYGSVRDWTVLIGLFVN